MERKNSSILFEEMGRVGTSVQLIEVRTELPMVKINRRIENVLGSMHATIKYMNIVRIPKSLTNALQQRIEYIRTHMNEVMMLCGYKNDGKTKRQVIVGLGVLGGWMLKGLFTKFFSSDDHSRYESEILDTLAQQEEELRAIRGAIRNLATKYDILKNVTMMLHNQLQEVERVETMIMVLTTISEQINKWIRGIQAGMTGRLTPDLLSINDVGKILDMVKERNHDGSISPVESESIGNFYSLPVQLERTANGLDVAVRLPLYYKDNLYELYKYRELPMTIEEGVRMSYRSPIGKYLVIDDIKGIYKEIETDELVDCIHIEDIRLCPHLRLFRIGQNGCLPALIHGNFKLAKGLCDIMLHKSDDVFVSQINDGKIFVDVQKTQRIKASCTSGSGRTTKRREALGSGQWMITLRNDCNVRIGDYLIGERPVTSKIKVRVVEMMILDEVEDVIADLNLHESWVYGNGQSSLKDKLELLTEPQKAISIDKLRIMARTARVEENRFWIYGIVVIETLLIIIFSGFFVTFAL
ncbi:uncharacterized protein [Lepeophtheirus salmonis]|uniref:uncharacterized protein n=1 Tax=Lepeophtheirus salmonis TaxID=72036 RepID=UPI001AE6E9FE|nr:uncharacterized protein LOC121128865 [Lepeophtheirus salmonis]